MQIKPLETVFPELFMMTQIIVLLFSQSTGDPRCCINPLAHWSYRYNLTGPDRYGGGAVIPCKYILEIAVGKIENIKSILQDFFKEYSCTGKLSVEDQPSCLFWLIYFRTVWYLKRCIQNTVKHQTWSFLQNSYWLWKHFREKLSILYLPGFRIHLWFTF